MRMRRIILSSVACLAVPYFSTLSHGSIFFITVYMVYVLYAFV